VTALAVRPRSADGPAGAAGASVRLDRRWCSSAGHLDRRGHPSRRRRAGQPPSDDQVGLWLDAGGGDVAAALRGYERLATEVDRPGQDELVASIEARARNLTELYAGSLLANVVYPERGGGRSLGDTLYQRFKDGLDRLTGEVRAELEALDLTEPDDAGEAAATSYGPVASFPAPFLRDAGGNPIRF
jgi:hypothetical protein